MIITEISRRRKHLVCVKTDCGERLIDVDTADMYSLKVGMSLSDEKMEQICYSSELERAKSRALWLLSQRDYPRKELAEKLYKDFDREAADEAVCILMDAGLLDDAHFAEIYANELSEIRHMSRRNIRLELMKKGIDREIIDEVAESLPDDEIPAIKEHISLRYKNCFDDEKSYRRMVAGLARKGYSYGDIKRAVNEYIENERNLD